MTTGKRLISMVLVFVIMAGMLSPMVQAAESEITSKELMNMVLDSPKPKTATPAAEQKAARAATISRAQWLESLVETFGFTIDEDVNLDNYYTDLSESADYYDSVMTAIYYGLVDLLPGGPMEPDAPATREFAAYSLNACIGYMPQEPGKYTFSEVETVTYPTDIQVALDHGWFALSNGAFLPEQAITQAEADNMLADAAEYVASMQIDSGHDNQYEFRDDVIEITDAVEIETNADGAEVTIEDPSQTIKAGNKFVVYYNGLAIPYTAKKVTTSGGKMVIEATYLDFQDAIVTMDAQLEMDTDPLNFYAAEDTELIFIEETTGEVYASAEAASYAMRTSSFKVVIPKYTKKIDMGNGLTLSVSMELKNPKVCLDLNVSNWVGSCSVWLDTDVEATGKLSCNVLEALGEDMEIYVGGYEIPGVGGLGFYLNFEINGAISIVQKSHMTLRLTVSRNLLTQRKRTDVSCKLTEKGSSVNAELSAKMYLETKFGLYGKALPVKGYLYSETGLQAKVKYTTYREIEGRCTHFAGFLYAEYGAKVEWGFFSHTDTLDWNKELYKESNSPVKASAHYEDGIRVANCTREDYTGVTVDSASGTKSSNTYSRYNTSQRSSYGGSGLCRGSSSGYVNNKPVTIYTYRLNEDQQATIISYTGNATSLTIPTSLDGYDVIAIGDDAFEGNTLLKTVIMQDNIITVGDSAFKDCSNLTNITLSENLTTIGLSAFENCSSLRTLHLPSSLTLLERCAFNNCHSLQYVYIPKNMNTGDYCGENSFFPGPFNRCSSLNNIVFEKGITRIPRGLFYNCTGLKEITIPDTVTTIEFSAFRECSNLRKITLSSVLESIDKLSFAECSSLEAVTFPKTMTELGNSAFENCTSLMRVNIPKTMKTYTSAGENSFYPGPFNGCSSLNNIIFEEGITSIPRGLFYKCTGLKEITIPDTVTEIGRRAFAGCTSLLKAEIPESVTEIGNYCFENCSSLTSVQLPSNLTEIVVSMFENCTSLERIELPAAVTTIRDAAFNGCSSLMEIVWNEGLTKIEANVFENCDAMTSITIPDGVTSLGDEAFYDCDGLETVKMADTVTSMGTSVFYHNDCLKNVKLSLGLPKIPNNTFKECALLEEIVIPYYVTTIGSGAFNACPKLSKVVTHSNLTSIGSSAFSYPMVTKFYGDTGSYTETWCSSNGYTFNQNTVAATGITLDAKELSIAKGKTHTLRVNVAPADFADQIIFKSSKADVASIDASGKITAVAPGTATIKVTVGSVSASVKVTVTQAVTRISLNTTKLSLDVPKTHQLFATVTPADASNPTLNWTSSNNSVATVDSNGLVKAKGNGTAVITAAATDDSGCSASCTITVTDPQNIPVTGITLNKTSVSMDAMDTYQLTASVTPATAANQNLVWSSSDESVATVNSKGLVTAIAKGTATITAAAADGNGALATCKITVTNTAHIVKDVSELESSHTYPSSCNDFWLYTSTGAASLQVTFDKKTEMEDGFDYLLIYDGGKNLIGTYTGKELAGKTIEIPGDTVRIQIQSDDSGSEWGFKVTKITVLEQAKIAAPVVSIANVAETGKISLSWNKVEGAVKYQVYRATSKSGTYDLMKTTTGKSYTNTSAEAGKAYYYYVVAVDSNGGKSDQSNTVSRTCDLAQPVITLSNRASDGAVIIQWEKIEGIKEYQVHRATSKSGEYTLMKATTATSYTNTSTEAGKAYYYKVIAIHDKSAANSAFSEIESRTADLAQPKITLSNVASSGKIKVSWEKIDGAKEYQVHRATSKSGNYTLMKTTKELSYTNTSAEAGKAYYYKVIAIHDKSAANSEFSEIKSRTADLAQPKITLSNVASSGKIKVSWEKIDGAKEYQVHRATSKSGEYTLMKTTTATSYTNTSVEAGKTYYYKVLAVHEKSAANSDYSESKSRMCDLAAPVVSVTLNSSGKPVVSWKAIAGAEKYTVYMYDRNGDLVKSSTTTNTKLTFSSAVKGKTYTYQVMAVHSNTNANSAKSSGVSIKSQ